MSYVVPGLPEPEDAEVLTVRTSEVAPLEDGGLLAAIQRAMRADGRSQRSLAKASGLRPEDMSRIIRGKQGLSLASADRLCAALGLVLCRRVD